MTASRMRQIEDAVTKAILAERERIAAWHDTQAAVLEAEIARIISEGGWVDATRRSTAELHYKFAKAIRDGDQ
jgi:hypothetical protein